MMNKKQPVFEETHAAAKLLDEFHSLTQKTKPPKEDAANVFFDKYYLTMADFLAPIGSVLTRTARENIHDFILTSVHSPAKSSALNHVPVKGKKLQTIRDFFSSLN